MFKKRVKKVDQAVLRTEQAAGGDEDEDADVGKPVRRSGPGPKREASWELRRQTGDEEWSERSAPMAPNTDVLRREQSEAEEKTIKHAYSTSALEELRQASSRPPLPNQSSPENAMEELERVRLAHQAYDGAGLDEEEEESVKAASSSPVTSSVTIAREEFDEENEEWETELLRRSGQLAKSSSSVATDRVLLLLERQEESTPGGNSWGTEELLSRLSRDLDKKRHDAQEAERNASRCSAKLENTVKERDKSKAMLQVVSQRYDILAELSVFLQSLCSCLQVKSEMVAQVVAAANAAASLKEHWSEESELVSSILSICEQRGLLISQNDGGAFQRSACVDEFGRAKRQAVQQPPDAEISQAIAGFSLGPSALASLESRQLGTVLVGQRGFPAPRRADLERAASLVFADVSPPYDNPCTWVPRLAEWRRQMPEAYAATYCDLALADVIAPYVKLQLSTWDPWEEEPGPLTESRAFSWRNCTESLEPLSADFVARLVETTIVPFLATRLMEAWEPSSEQHVRRALECLNVLEGLSSNKVGPLDAIAVDRMTRRADEVCLPLLGAHEDQSLRTFQTRQLALSLALVGNMLAWAERLGKEHVLSGKLLKSARDLCTRLAEMAANRGAFQEVVGRTTEAALAQSH